MHLLTALEIHQLFITGQVTAQEIVSYFFERIERLDPFIGAFVLLLKERAFAKAQQLDKKFKAGCPMGKLAAIPMAVKDNIDVKGYVTTNGSLFFKNSPALFDAQIIEALEAEDALLLGKTNLDEFAMGSTIENSAIQLTRNPWNLLYSPGGSSGGSAAAVAARFCPMAIGSDTGGSIRLPAAFCGTVGFKPTYGSFSSFGTTPLAPSFDQLGFITSTVSDLKLTMNAIGSIRLPLQTFPLPYLKIGVSFRFLNYLSKKGLSQESLSQEASHHFNRNLNLLKSTGLKIIELDLPILKCALEAYTILTAAEAAISLSYLQETGTALIGKEVKHRLLFGRALLSNSSLQTRYEKAKKMRLLIMQAFKRAFTHCHLIALPTTLHPAPLIGSISSHSEDFFTCGVNLAGLPALSLPSGFSTDSPNLPLGCQFIAPPKEEILLLDVASAVEKLLLVDPCYPPWLK